MSDTEPLATVELVTGPKPQHSVIWLHGLGADGNDFAPVVPELRLPKGLAVRFVFPHAPMRPVTINGGYVMRAWYDIAEADFSRRSDERGIRDSQRAVEALIAREKARGVPANRLVLAGFSQGGAIALQAGLRHPERLAGIVALSTYLPVPETVPAEAAAANRDTPLFMGHGTRDAVVPFAWGERSRRMLQQMGYRVEWHQYPLEHSVNLEEIRDIGRWLARVLA